MFTVPRNNVIESDEGFSVQILGRTGIEYREGLKSLFIDSEILSSGHGIAIYKDSIKCWRAPHSEELIDIEERNRVLENVRRAITFRNQPVEIL